MNGLNENLSPFNELESRYFNAVHEQALQLATPGSYEHQLYLATHAQPDTIKNTSYLSRFWKHRKGAGLGFGLAVTALIFIFAIFSLFVPQSMHYSFSAKSSCTTSPLLFPTLFKSSSRDVFLLHRNKTISIGKTALYSSQICASPNQSPNALASYRIQESINVLGLRLSKTFTVSTPKYPLVFAGALGAKSIPIEKPLSFKLGQIDNTFQYAITTGAESASCQETKQVLQCSLVPLKLGYSQTYTTRLVREFHGKTTGTLFTRTVKTITAMSIAQTSIAPGAEVYNQPQQIILTAAKPIIGMKDLSLTYKNSSGATTTIPITSSYKDQTITVSFSNPLPREVNFDLHINSLSGNDGSDLEQPYDLTFTTSGGPKVVGSSIPSYGLNSGQALVLNFDQAINPSQAPTQFISLLVNGASVPATLSLTGQQLVIQPSSGYPVCATVTVQVSSSAQNAFGVSGNSSWSYSTRSHCYTTFSIGTSVKGRPITAYKFGNGSSMVLYIAAMEGNEQNSANLLQQWIPNIDANPGKIPSYRTLVVIPQINPDGYAADTRLNAAGIDLNRNFPANNWQTQVTEPLGNGVWTNDGGPSPLSAPESQALASYYLAQHPRLTLTMHSHGAIVEANDAGDSIPLGAQYASLADYRAIPTSQIGNFFNYTTTGAFEDWANDKIGLPVLEVELQSPTNDEYSRNLPALWAMARVSP